MSTLRLLCLLLLAHTGFGATYYIDLVAGNDVQVGTKVAPWLHAPGMDGFSATYTHAAGDRFIFKGGQTCGSAGTSCLSGTWSITNSGSAGNNDYYGVDQTWYAGASWSIPVIDGGHKNPVTIDPYIDLTGSYVTLDGLRIQNIGVSPAENGGVGLNQGNYVIDINGTNHDILIENMIFAPQSRIAILLSLSGTLSNFEFKNNNFSACSWGLGGGGGIVSNFSFHDNIIHDLHDQIASGAHGDGLYIWGDVSSYLVSPVIYNNVGYGDFGPSEVGNGSGMSEFLWISAASGNAYFYNNVWTSSDTNGTAGVLNCGGPDATHLPNCYFYNNSIALGTYSFYGIRANWANTVTVENNIITGGSQAIAMAQYHSIGTLVSNYNDLAGFSSYCGSDNDAAYGSWAQFRAAGYEANGFSADPKVVSSTDLHLQSSSPLVGQGINLHSTFIVDAGGVARPTAGAWDIGAYQYAVFGTTFGGAFSAGGAAKW